MARKTTRESLKAARKGKAAAVKGGKARAKADKAAAKAALPQWTKSEIAEAFRRFRAADPEPKGDWAQHSLRVLNVIDNQVRSLRKRQLIDSYVKGMRAGAYWGIGSRFEDYRAGQPPLADPLSGRLRRQHDRAPG